MIPLRAALRTSLALAPATLAASVLGLAPNGLAAATCATTAGLFGLGVVWLRGGAFVDVAVRASGARRAIALTFDDGPHPEHTPRVLDALAACGARATFFVVGDKAHAHPEVVRAIAAAGHALGLHSSTHDCLFAARSTARLVDDLRANRAVVEDAIGAPVTLVRPPVGLTSPSVASAVHALGLRVVGWSARAYDGIGSPSPATILLRLAPDLAPGAIVLLHDARERGDDVPPALAALPALLDELARRDLTSVTVPALLDGLREPAA
jgi:peptidoglycan/xylan/chitin deacetylase (PgdA/CDA1 family)